MRYDAIIIGGGPSGLTAGLYASRFGLKTLLLERGVFGGQIINAKLIENYPGFPEGIAGYDLALLMHQQAIKYGLEVRNIEVTGIKINKPYEVITSENVLQTDAIIIATGSQYSKLEVEGEEQYVGRGVSYCATCDGYMFRDREVAVIGGGDTALTDAIELSQHASKVYVIHRRDQLRASQILQNRAFKNPKLEFIWNSIVTRIEGDVFVKTISLKNVRTNDEKTINVSGVFVAIGLKPNSEIFQGLVQIDSNGSIIVDSKMVTSEPGIFAAGDVRQNSIRQVSAAVGDGAIAALSAYKFIKQ